MPNRTFELSLPLDDGASGDLARRRIDHLGALGVDDQVVQRLARAFPSLRDIYAARDEELERVVGSVTAARIRWFLDAPLDSGAASAPRLASGVRSMLTAA